MPKFHFEIVDGYTLEDPYGMDLPTVSQAEAIARQIAVQIAQDIDDSDLKEVVVKTDAGEEVYKAPIPKTSD